MAVYGFGRENAAQLVKVARREGLRKSSAGGIEYADTTAERNYAIIRFRNDSGEAIPGYGLMRVTGMASVDDLKIITTDKPSSSYIRDGYLVNGPEEITISSSGWGTWLWHADYVLYDTGNTPAYGEEWGPEASSWTIKKDAPGFIIQGGNTGTGAASRTIAKKTPVATLWGKPDGSYSVDGTGNVTLWDKAFAGSLGLTMSSVIFRTRDVTTATRVSITPDGIAFPIDCEDS